jgi:hypothetical protein
MSRGNAELAAAVKEALNDGETATPDALVALAGSFDNPIQSLINSDTANELFDALDREFAFVRASFVQHGPTPPPEIGAAERLRYAALVRWLILELRGWRGADDPRQAKLVAAFVVAQRCDSGEGLWSLLPDDIGENVELLNHLERLLTTFAISFDAQPGAAVPIWEGEAVDQFKRADAEGDWPAVLNGWQNFHRQPIFHFANVLQIQTVRQLRRYGAQHLVNGLSKLHQTPVLVQIAGVLPPEQRLRLAIDSDNPHVHFAVLYRTIVFDRRRQGLNAAENELLTTLLLRLANDAAAWGRWLRAFIGYQPLQVALGRALASAPDAAISGYIDSIRLHPWLFTQQTSGVDVAECLREFNANASLERRQSLWRRTHDRWLVWDFDRANPNSRMTTICRSDLDYAVVAYARECLDEAGRESALNAIRAEAQTLEHRWYESVSDLHAAWYRLLSRFQPYAHSVCTAAQEADWLPNGRLYFSFDPEANKYLLAMYEMTWPPRGM